MRWLLLIVAVLFQFALPARADLTVEGKVCAL
jgi:hypothetical protein